MPAYKRYHVPKHIYYITPSIKLHAPSDGLSQHDRLTKHLRYPRLPEIRRPLLLQDHNPLYPFYYALSPDADNVFTLT